MDSATPRPSPSLRSLPPAPLRKRGPLTSLRIDTPALNSEIALVQSDSSAGLSSATSDSDSFVFPTPSKPRTTRNMKKLSLTLPSAQSSTNSLLSMDSQRAEPQRRLSIVSLHAAVPATSLRRKGEEDQALDSSQYQDGPVQILPGIWLGSEDNVRDWRGHRERGIKSILNVAKEVSTIFDAAKPHRAFMSTPDLNAGSADAESTYYPAHVPSGRPAMHYLKLNWSHGQADLVHTGFPAAFAFVDRALERGDGVLIHCQCGVSRSATLVIALVMRAAAQRSPNVPCGVWALKGMQGAYDFVKEKSHAIGPNMSLIYQLLDYERTFKAGTSSPASFDRSPSEAEWSRQRMLMDEAHTDDDRESIEVMQEARALDQAMEDRLLARKSSMSSMSSSGSCPRRSRYASRKRAGSIASVMTGSTLLSEHLVEEDEEPELSSVGSGFDESSEGTACSSAEPTEDEDSRSRKDSGDSKPSTGFLTARQVPAVRMPPSAPYYRSSFNIPPPPATAIRASFDLTPRPLSKMRGRKPPTLAILPPVPSSPIIAVNSPPSPLPANARRRRADARKPALPPADLRIKVQHPPRPKLTAVSTPSQTLFVFPPSPTLSTRTPSTMTLTSNASFLFPPSATPRVSSFKADGRRRSFIGVPPPSTPTIASSRVDARGWFGGLGLGK